MKIHDRHFCITNMWKNHISNYWSLKNHETVSYNIPWKDKDYALTVIEPMQAKDCQVTLQENFRSLQFHQSLDSVWPHENLSLANLHLQGSSDITAVELIMWRELIEISWLKWSTVLVNLKFEKSWLTTWWYVERTKLFYYHSDKNPLCQVAYKIISMLWSLLLIIYCIPTSTMWLHWLCLLHKLQPFIIAWVKHWRQGLILS